MTIKYRYELVDLLKHLGLPLIAVELGVAEGYFSHDLLSRGLDKLYSVDMWQTLNQKGDGGFAQQWHDKNLFSAKERLSVFGEKSIILRGMTVDMAHSIEDNSVGMVYVDGNHSYESVKNDISAYWSKIVSGGIMAFHDTENEAYGVKEAVYEFAQKNNLEIYNIPENKPDDAGQYIIKK